MTRRKLLARRGLLNHLEFLIYDWQNDGCISYDVEAALAADQTSHAKTYHILSALEGDIVCMDLGHLVDLSLENSNGGYVEGLYLREAAIDGTAGIEVTIVCGGPRWAQLELLPFGDALRTASRIAIGFVQLDEDFSRALTPGSLEGDRALVNDKALVRAIDLADKMLGVLAVGNRYEPIIGPRCPRLLGYL